MSFEGYYQCVCKNGHYFEIDVYEVEEDIIEFVHKPKNGEDVVVTVI